VSAYTEYFLNSPSSVVQLELLEISHPNFTQTYRVVRNATQGITATIDGAPAFFQYVPMKINLSSQEDDMDYGLDITFGDLGEILPKELDAVMATSVGMTLPPLVRFWVFRSDALTVPLYGPLVMQVDSFTFTKTGATFQARAARLNNTKTGELYLLTRFPTLRGFL
jgi:hypothetical protein